MTQVTQQQPVLNFNDKEYVINELSPECQSCLVYMQEIDQKINELNKEKEVEFLSDFSQLRFVKIKSFNIGND